MFSGALGLLDGADHISEQAPEGYLSFASECHPSFVSTLMPFKLHSDLSRASLRTFLYSVIIWAYGVVDPSHLRVRDISDLCECE